MSERRKVLKSLMLGTGALFATSSLAQDICGITPAQTEGPFYPIVDQEDKDWDLTRVKGRSQPAKGEVVFVKGMVQDENCKPIKGAMVEIWHCNTEGEYDNESEHFQLRGKSFSNEKGEYSFKTILPGKYLNGGKFRPAHIHFRVTAKNSEELISQIYFHGDPHITADPWASKEKAERRILPISLEDTKGNLAVAFDVFLKDK